MSRPWSDFNDSSAASRKANDLKSQRIKFRVGFFSSGPEHLIGIITDRTTTWRGNLLGQLYNALGR